VCCCLHELTQALTARLELGAHLKRSRLVRLLQLCSSRCSRINTVLGARDLVQYMQYTVLGARVECT
jgi:hypothetical protein